MTTVIVEIINKKALKILEGLEDASLIKLKNKNPMSAEKIRILKGIASALKEVDLHERGITKLQSAREFLNEI
ncbi:MAG: hypothetical protein ABIQ74_05070 [Chitinophagales bacterium]